LLLLRKYFLEIVKKIHRPKIFFGWWTAIATGLLSGFGAGYRSQGFSIFLKPLSAELGLSRAATSAVSAVGTLEGGLAYPLAGWLSDKLGPRAIIFAGTCMFIVGLVLMYFVNSLWLFVVTWGVLSGLGSTLAYSVAADKAVTNWFVRKRGIALGIRFMLWGAGSAVVLPIVGWLVATQGWRTTNLIWACVTLPTLAVIWFLIKPHRPEYYGLMPDGAGVKEETKANSQIANTGAEYAAEIGEVEYSVKQAWKTRSFWFLLVSWTISQIVIGALSIHMIPFLTDTGIDTPVASGMMSLSVICTIPARFIGGAVADRMRKDRLQYLLAGTFALLTVGITILIFQQSIAMLFFFLILYGLGSGAGTPLRLVIGSRYFGRKSFGSILGSMLMAQSLLGFVSPIYAGWIFDTTGSYSIVFITFAALTAISTFIMLLVRPPEPPAASPSSKPR
jgi:MFS family permease